MLIGLLMFTNTPLPKVILPLLPFLTGRKSNRKKKEKRGEGKRGEKKEKKNNREEERRKEG
jgi:hypothetical protein